VSLADKDFSEIDFYIRQKMIRHVKIGEAICRHKHLIIPDILLPYYPETKPSFKNFRLKKSPRYIAPYIKRGA